ncbi:MAG: serine hydroxymethyltransferase [bacterium]|nr:serine hydroxymethyltransferase [bacterium]
MASKIQQQDKEMARLIGKEEKRQKETLALIPSENYCSPAVREALGSIFVAKYSEGRPLKRYYGGMEVVDELEEEVENRVRKVFGLKETDWAVNVQPYSGSPANYAVLRGILNPGDTILSLDLGHGGHLTHGSPVSLSGIDFRIVHYLVDQKTKKINYEEILRQAKKVKPKLIIAGHSSYPGKLDFAKFGKIAREVGALLLADTSHVTGLIIGKVHPSPFPHADIVTSTTHKTLRGPRGAMIICREELRKKIFPKVFPGLQGGPHNHTIAAIGVAVKEAQSAKFRMYASQVVKNAKALARALKARGFSLVSGGTENHLILIDLTSKGVSGKPAQDLLEQAGIVTNRNVIPFDTRKPFDPSGLRIGTPSVTTRGMKEKDMEKIADWMNRVLLDPSQAEKVRKEVKAFCSKYPLFSA